ncbi:MAG: UDP-glucose--hexose-1-phosphate uridylyltransferase [Ancalomicrobiaceae bacterium]|nr:UDP-glucose--hexose-1-phosphate uridylyltransferase [Ancalomicrobiaceae bacterium]
MDVRFQTNPHRRLNPLTGEWVLVSPHRALRPWQGQQEKAFIPEGKPHDPGCYLCRGNVRANGMRNPDYQQTFVFDNDFAALKADSPEMAADDAGLMVAEGESGSCRVVCFSARHDLTLARMATADIARVIDVWVEQFVDLAGRDDIGYVQIFENRGEIMGCSNPHPHGQIWASRTVPNEVAKECDRQTDYLAKTGRPLLLDYLDKELVSGERIVFHNEHFVVLVPFWAVWPFETMLLPRRAVTGLDQLAAGERQALAEAVSVLTIRYDNLFQTSFPYSMGFHQRPTDGSPHPEWVLHAHFYPPLLRSASVKKFMVGYELLAGPQRDITPESAAERLRALPAIHYLDLA